MKIEKSGITFEHEHLTKVSKSWLSKRFYLYYTLPTDVLVETVDLIIGTLSVPDGKEVNFDWHSTVIVENRKETTVRIETEVKSSEVNQ